MLCMEALKSQRAVKHPRSRMGNSGAQGFNGDGGFVGVGLAALQSLDLYSPKPPPYLSTGKYHLLKTQKMLFRLFTLSRQKLPQASDGTRDHTWSVLQRGPHLLGFSEHPSSAFLPSTGCHWWSGQLFGSLLIGNT